MADYNYDIMILMQGFWFYPKLQMLMHVDDQLIELLIMVRRIFLTVSYALNGGRHNAVYW